VRNAFRAIEKNSSTIKKVFYVSSVAALADLDNIVLRKEIQQRPASVTDRNTNSSLQNEYPYDFLQCQALKEVERMRGEISVPVVFLYVGFPVGPVLETSRRSGNVMDWAGLYLHNTFDRKRQRVYCYSNVQDVAYGIRRVFASDKIKSGNDYIIAEAQPTHPMKVYDIFRNYKADLVKYQPSNEERQRMLEEAQRFKSMTALDISKTKTDLGIQPQDSEKSLSVMIKSLVDQNLLPTAGLSA
jgi:nucleoside-diphosphate-sugar epimerase